MEELSQISVWFLTNCGILLEYKNHQLLIDGLFKRPPEEVGNSGLYEMPEKTYQDILNRNSPFTNIELLLFTHIHWDHCDIDSAKAYCKKYNTSIFTATKNSSDYIYKNEWIRVESISCVHDISSNTDNRKHCCFRIELGGKTFLFTGDIDTKSTPIRSQLLNKPIDYLFYNVHHLFHTEGRVLIQNYIKPNHLFIQHLPNPKDDPFELNRRLTNKLKVFGEKFPPYTILNKPMSRIL